MTELPASVLRDVVRFIDEVGVAFHIDTSYLVGVRECVPCAYIIAYWYQYIKYAFPPNNIGTNISFFVHYPYWYQYSFVIYLK